MQAQQNVTETEILMSDPTALGVFGLAMVTFVAASQKMGWTTGVTYLIPWALFLGSIAQVWASFVDFKKNNYFGAIVLGAYGLFWLAVGMHWAISLGWFGAVGDKADPRQLAFACFGYTIFSLFIMSLRSRRTRYLRPFGADQYSAAIAGAVDIRHQPRTFFLAGRLLRTGHFVAWLVLCGRCVLEHLLRQGAAAAGETFWLYARALGVNERARCKRPKSST